MADVPRLTKAQLAGAMSTLAVKVAADSNNTHPVDIACSMSIAIEYAGEMLATLRDLGFIDWEN